VFFAAAFLMKSPEIEILLGSVRRRIVPVKHP
jgi:hypothetical protein